MPPEFRELTRSTRDPDRMRAAIEAWMRERTGDPEATVAELRSPSASGMSSETLFVDATWDSGDGPVEHALVARVEPDDVDLPVFPTYDLDAQYRVLGLVAEQTDVPVPRTRWMEPAPDVLGKPFFVMDRVDGRVPPDNLPYTFEGWVLEGSDEDRRRLQDASVTVLAGIHAIDLDAVEDLSFLHRQTEGVPGSPLQRHVAVWRQYYDWMRGDQHYPLLEAAFAWLEANWPDDEGDTVVSWGDARIGNTMYEPDGWEPVAVLDWEMVALGPRGVDVGWMSFLHTFFQDLAETMGLPGLPDFLRVEDVAAIYATLTGVEIQDLDWYVAYAALRHGCVMARVEQRRVHFGEAEPPATPDDAIMHRARLARLIGHPTTGEGS